MLRRIAAAVGLFGALFPRVPLRIHARSHYVGYRNTDQLEPRGWLVALTRLVSLALFVAAVRAGGGE